MNNAEKPSKYLVYHPSIYLSIYLSITFYTVTCNDKSFYENIPIKIRCILFPFFSRELYCELNYHDRKIRRTLTHDIRKHWTAVLTLLGLISIVYRITWIGISNPLGKTWTWR